jgi:hypothetical protein
MRDRLRRDQAEHICYLRSKGTEEELLQYVRRLLNEVAGDRK